MWRRSLNDEVGLFSKKYKAAGDYDFMLRGATRAKGVHVREPLGLLLRRVDSITFRDGTMNREVAEVKKCYRNPEHALELYRIEGVDVSAPGISEACYIDLGNRALAYFPQWRGGQPDADLEFAQLCYRWALNTASETPESEEVKRWASANLEAAKALSIGAEMAEGLNPSESRSIDKGIDSGSANERNIPLIWPEIGLSHSSERRSSVLGKVSEKSSTQWEGLGYRESWVEPFAYWARLIGFDPKDLSALKSRIETNQTIMIWGASARGMFLSKVCQFCGISIEGFIDNDTSKMGGYTGGLPVVGFDQNQARDNNWKAILAVSEQQRVFVLDQLDGCGMRDILMQI